MFENRHRNEINVCIMSKSPDTLSHYSICSFMCTFCRSLFVLLYFFFWPLCHQFFFDIRILIFLFEICKLFFYLGRHLEFDLLPRIIGRCYLLRMFDPIAYIITLHLFPYRLMYIVIRFQIITVQSYFIHHSHFHGVMFSLFYMIGNHWFYCFC